MRNVYFFQCQDFFGSSIFLPYASGCLWAYARQNDRVREHYHLQDLFFEKLPVKDYISRIKDPDVIFFSTYGWNVNYHLAVAHEIRQHWPDALLVFGGPSAEQSVEWLQQNPQVDVSIWGAGEQPVESILLARLDDGPMTDIPGVYQMIDGQVLGTPAAERERGEYENYPSPYLEGLFDHILRQHPYTFNVILETNRGCPYSCTFCDIGRPYFNQVKKFQDSKVFQELQWFSDNKIEYIDIADSNFGLYERDLDIVRHIKHLHDTTGWPKKINTTWAKSHSERVLEMSKILADMNRLGVTMALQSSDQVVLKNIKRKNVANERLRQLTESYEREGIVSYHDFIMGLPGETLASWKRGLLEITDIAPESWINGQPAEVYVHTEFNDPDYIERFGLDIKTLPIGVMFARPLPDGIPKEVSRYVVATADMPADDFIEAFVFRVFVVTLHCMGWAKHSVSTVAQQAGTTASDVYDSLWDWIKTQPGFLHDCFQRVFQESRDLFEGRRDYWGRRVFGDDDVAWDYNSALSIEFEQNRDRYFQDLRRFFRGHWPNIDSDTAVDYNDLQVMSWDRAYPCQLGQWSTEKPPETRSFYEYCRDLYWFGRRQKLWKLAVSKT